MRSNWIFSGSSWSSGTSTGLLIVSRAVSSLVRRIETSIGSFSSSASNFAVTTPAPLAAEGAYQVIAVATDTAGNTSTPSLATLITVDTTPPTVTRPTVNGHS